MSRSILGSKFTYVVIGMLLAAPVQMSGEKKASRQQMPEIRANLYNYAQIPGGDLSLAKRTAARIFRQAGVKITWSDVPVSGSAEVALRSSRQQVGPADLRIRVLPESKVPGWAKKTHQVAFSLLPNNGRFATISSIYADRIRKISRRENRPTGLVLGCVIAHEIGHLLLPMKGHTRTGIMSFPITGRYLSRASLGRLGFTNAQANKLRREAWKRTSDLAGAYSPPPSAPHPRRRP